MTRQPEPPESRGMPTPPPNDGAAEQSAIDYPATVALLRDRLERLRQAAAPFAAHDWMDAELEDDSCQLTRHSGPVTVGHWRALRASLPAPPADDKP